jgi:hypothetical protein
VTCANRREEKERAQRKTPLQYTGNTLFFLKAGVNKIKTKMPTSSHTGKT